MIDSRFEFTSNTIDKLKHETSFYKKLFKEQPELYEVFLVETLTKLADEYHQIEKLSDALDIFQEIVSFYEKMIKSCPDKYSLKLAEVLTQKAIYLIKSEKIEEANPLLERSLTLYENFAKESDQYCDYIAPILLNLGLIESSDKSYKTLERCASICQIAALKNPKKYEKFFSAIILELSNEAKYKPAQVRNSFQKISDILKTISKEYPDIFQKHLALTLNLLGKIFGQLDELNNSSDCHEQALEIYDNLPQYEQGQWDSNIIDTLNSLILIFDELKNLNTADIYCKRALEICKLPHNNRKSMKPKYAMTLANYGLVKQHREELPIALEYYYSAQKIFEELTEQEPLIFQEKLALTVFNLGEVEFQSKKLNKACNSYKYSLSLYKKLEESKPIIYSINIASTLHRIGDIYSVSGHKIDAIHHYLDSLIYYKKSLSSKNIEYMRRALFNLLECCESAERKEEPVFTILNSVKEIYVSLAKDSPFEFESDLAAIDLLIKRLADGNIQLTNYSYIPQESITCFKCGSVFIVDLCLILDTEIHVDLYRQFREDKIHNYTCTNCGANNYFDAPLLLYRSKNDPTLIFIPARETSQNLDKEHSNFLLNYLRNTLNEGWDEKWLNPLTSVSYESSRFVFSEEAESFQFMEAINLIQATLEFANTIGWEEARKLIRVHPNLLTPLADKIFSQMLIDESDISAKLAVYETRQILRRCQQIGIDEAFDEKKGLVKNDPNSHDVVKAVQDILNTPTWEKARDVINFHGERLLCELSENLLESMRNKMDSFEDGAVYYDQHLQFIKKVRTEGIEAALIEFSGSKEDPIKALDPVKAFLFATTWESTQKVVFSHRDRLLSKKTENQLLEASEHLRPYDIDGAGFIDLHRNILLNVRQQGIEKAFNKLRGAKNNPLKNFHLRQNQLSSYKDKEVLEIASRDLVINEREKFHRLINTNPRNFPENIMELMKGALNKTFSPRRRITCCNEFIKYVEKNEFPVMWSTFQLEYAHLLTEEERSDIYGENLELAIRTCNEVIKHINRLDDPKFKGIWGQALLYLGEANRQRTLGNKRENKEIAISLYQEAHSVFSRNLKPRMWALTHHYLGCAFDERVEGNAGDNIEEAIKHYQKALEIRTKNSEPREWVITTVNLGNAYKDRICGDKAENIEYSIALYKSALTKASSKTHPLEYARIQHALGNSLRDRLVGNSSENINEAIACHKKAMEVWAKEDESKLDLAIAQATLGIDYMFLEALDDRYIEEAIKYLNHSLQIITLKNHPDYWATIHHNLGLAYLSLGKCDIDQKVSSGIKHTKMALKYYTRLTEPVRWGASQIILGNLYAQKNDKNSNQLALECFQNCKSVISFTEYPNWHIEVTRSLGKLHFENHDWFSAAEAYKDARKVIQYLYKENATDFSRKSLIECSSEITANGAYCLARLGSYSEAVEWLEVNRTQAVTEYLNRDTAVLDLATKKDREEFYSKLKHLKDLEANTRQNSLLLVEIDRKKTLEKRFGELREARDKFLSIVTKIRSYLPDFMLDKCDIADIAKVAKFNSPIVYLVSTSQGSIALVVTHNSTELDEENLVWIDEFNTEILNKLLLDIDETGDFISGFLIGQLEPEIAKTYFLDQGFLNVLLEALYSKLLVPLVQRLQQLGFTRITLVPCGRLSLLPLHAAVIDTITINYIPSNRLLTNIAKTNSKKLEFINPILLAVANPLPQSKEVSNLEFAKIEVEAIKHFFSEKHRRVLCDYDGKRETVINKLPGATHLHFACHGAFDINNPLLSGLSLSFSEMLTLGDLLDGHLNLSSLSLVVLSACSTGVISSEIPDEMVGLPAGFLYAGAAGVVSTMWSVNDLSSAIFMYKFYALNLESSLDPGEALRKTQYWMRETTSQQKASFFQDSHPQLYIQLMLLDPNYFSHPFHWAAFTYTGV